MLDAFRSIGGWALRLTSFFGCFFANWLPFRLRVCNNSPTTTTTPPSIGTYYYPWWDNNRTNTHWPEGYLREHLSQEPLLGEYSVRDQAVIDQHLQWAKDYRIQYLITSWWGRDSWEDITTRDYLLASNNLGGVQVALFYESFGLLQKEDDRTIHFEEGGANEQQLRSDLEYMAETYFDHPNYLKMNGRPVVFFYVSRVYRGSYRQVFDNVRSHIQANYNYCGLYLIGDEVYWSDPKKNVDRIQIFDAITAYNMHGPSRYDGYPDDTNFIVDVESTYKNYQKVANDLQVDLIPGILPAFNDRGVRLEADHYVIPHEVRAELAGTGQYTTLWESLLMAYRVLQSCQDENSPAIVMITSWNEFHEDTNIEPTKGTAGSSNEPFLYTQGYTYQDYGFQLLELIPKFLDEFAAV